MDLREIAKKHKENIILAIIIIASFVAMSIQSGRFDSIPERVGMGISSGVQSVFTSIQRFFSRTIRSVSELRDLREDYNQLLDRLEESEQIFASMEAIRQENQILRETLGYSKSLDFTNIPAQIIGKDPGIIFNSFIINKGGRQGVQEGMPVVGYQNGEIALVGKVLQVSWTSSIVRPLVDPQSYIAGRLTRTRYEGLIRGLGSTDNVLLMEYLDREARNQISVGDEVITSGLNSVYPANLRIGIVSAISATSYDTSLALEVVPFVNYTSLEQVYVLRGNKEEDSSAPLFIQAEEDGTQPSVNQTVPSQSTQSIEQPRIQTQQPTASRSNPQIQESESQGSDTDPQAESVSESSQGENTEEPIEVPQANETTVSEADNPAEAELTNPIDGNVDTNQPGESE